jgi:hypothetical protein
MIGGLDVDRLGQHTDRPSGGARQGMKACVAAPECERFVKLQEAYARRRFIPLSGTRR